MSSTSPQIEKTVLNIIKNDYTTILEHIKYVFKDGVNPAYHGRGIVIHPIILLPSEDGDGKLSGLEYECTDEEKYRGKIVIRVPRGIKGKLKKHLKSYQFDNFEIEIEISHGLEPLISKDNCEEFLYR